MTTCEYCDLISREQEVLYADDDIIIAVKDKVVTPGQLIVFPRQHLTILEMMSDSLLEKCALMANKVGAAVFESLGSQGTNIIVQNGLGAGQSVPHFGIEIIPRLDNDGLNFQWEHRQLMEDEVEMTHALLADGVQQLEKAAHEKKSEHKETTPKKILSHKEGSKNYLLKSIERIP